MSDIADFREYAKTRDASLRERLIEENYGLVVTQAAKLARTLPRTILLNDLKSWGSLGLIDAVEKFDPARGFAFSTYAVMRIRGAMFDGIQSQEWLPKAKITKLRELGRAQDALEAEGEDGTVDQIAERMESTVDEVRELMHDRSSQAVISIEGRTATYREDSDIQADSWLGRSGDESVTAELSEISARTLAALGQLSDDEAAVMVRVYVDGVTLKDLAIERDQPAGSVTVLHTRALTRVRELLALFGGGVAA